MHLASPFGTDSHVRLKKTGGSSPLQRTVPSAPTYGSSKETEVKFPRLGEKQSDTQAPEACTREELCRDRTLGCRRHLASGSDPRAWHLPLPQREGRGWHACSITAALRSPERLKGQQGKCFLLNAVWALIPLRPCRGSRAGPLPRAEEGVASPSPSAQHLLGLHQHPL